eukprot:TRINITY_DN376_c2_g1_i1.p1 TRINITY_DN376_c2_g1~~TRINITY_DN376_c2_g1_i1.p1  ORF type:complete len:1192 (+),score=382.41 TRINITY_DN376_c2_g1_i1:34-3609(+)
MANPPQDSVTTTKLTEVDVSTFSANPTTSTNTSTDKIVLSVANVDIYLLNYQVKTDVGAAPGFSPFFSPDSTFKPTCHNITIDIVTPEGDIHDGQLPFLRADKIKCSLMQTIPCIRSRFNDRLLYLFPMPPPEDLPETEEEAIAKEKAEIIKDLKSEKPPPTKDELVILGVCLAEGLTYESEVVAKLEEMLYRFTLLQIEDSVAEDPYYSSTKETSKRSEQSSINECLNGRCDVLWQYDDVEYHLVDFVALTYFLDETSKQRRKKLQQDNVDETVLPKDSTPVVDEPGLSKSEPASPSISDSHLIAAANPPTPNPFLNNNRINPIKKTKKQLEEEKKKKKEEKEKEKKEKEKLIFKERDSKKDVSVRPSSSSTTVSKSSSSSSNSGSTSNILPSSAKLSATNHNSAPLIIKPTPSSAPVSPNLRPVPPSRLREGPDSPSQSSISKKGSSIEDPSSPEYQKDDKTVVLVADDVVIEETIEVGIPENQAPVLPFQGSFFNGMFAILQSESQRVFVRVGLLQFYLTRRQTVVRKIYNKERLIYFFPMERIRLRSDDENALSIKPKSSESSDDTFPQQQDIVVVAVVLPAVLDALSPEVIHLEEILLRYGYFIIYEKEKVTLDEEFEKTKRTIFIERMGYRLRTIMITGAEKIGKGMISGSNNLNAKIKPNKKKTKVSKKTMQRIYNVRVGAGKVLSVSVKTMNSLSMAYKRVSYTTSKAATKTSLYRRIMEKPSSKRQNEAKEVFGATIEAGLGLYYALRDASRIITESASAAIVNTVNHKWGDEAGYAMQESLNGVRDIGLSAWYFYSVFSTGWKNLVVEGSFECIDTLINVRGWLCGDMLLRGTILHKTPVLIHSSYQKRYVALTNHALMVFYDKQHFMRVLQLLAPCRNLEEFTDSSLIRYIYKSSEEMIMKERKRIDDRKKRKKKKKRNLLSRRPKNEQEEEEEEDPPPMQMPENKPQVNADGTPQTEEQKKQNRDKVLEAMSICVTALPLEEIDFSRVEEEQADYYVRKHHMNNAFFVQTRDYAFHYFVAKSGKRAHKWVTLLNKYIVVAKEERRNKKIDNKYVDIDVHSTALPKYSQHDFLGRLPEQLKRPDSLASPEEVKMLPSHLNKAIVPEKLKKKDQSTKKLEGPPSSESVDEPVKTETPTNSFLVRKEDSLKNKKKSDKKPKAEASSTDPATGEKETKKKSWF